MLVDTRVSRSVRQRRLRNAIFMMRNVVLDGFESGKPKLAGDRGSHAPGLPEYAKLQAAEHSAHQPELARIVAELPIDPSDLLLDVPCGDGFYTRLLAGRLGSAGGIIAADISAAFLERCARTMQALPSAPSSVLAQADAYRLPFRAGQFDFVWCAKSFMSLGNPVRVLREIRRVLRVGGTVGVLESDELHDLVLPWPAALELAVHQARRAASRRRGRRVDRLYVGRHLQDVFHSAGLLPVDKNTYTVDRRWPLPEAEREFLALYFDALWRDVAGVMAADAACELKRHIDPASEDYLPNRPDFESTAIDVLFLGRKVRE
jgi:SAM-dependent methyltransferase